MHPAVFTGQLVVPKRCLGSTRPLAQCRSRGTPTLCSSTMVSQELTSSIKCKGSFTRSLRNEFSYRTSSIVVRYTAAMSHAAVICFLGMSIRLTAADHVLDFVATTRSEAGFVIGPSLGSVPLDDRFTGHGVVVSPHAAPAASPFTFTVTSLSFDAEGYAFGAPMIYEVRLTNVGSQSVQFPWSIDGSQFDRREPGACLVGIWIAGVAQAAQGKVERLSGLYLYGAPAVTGSLESIAPGDTVLIRVKSDWMASIEGIVNVSVAIDPDIAGQTWPPLTSQNVVSIMSRRK